MEILICLLVICIGILFLYIRCVQDDVIKTNDDIFNLTLRQEYKDKIKKCPCCGAHGILSSVNTHSKHPLYRHLYEIRCSKCSRRKISYVINIVVNEWNGRYNNE